MNRVEPVPATHALSIRQPWAWLILHAGKDIENRTWPTKRRGRVWVHAAKGMTRDEYEEAFEFAFLKCGVATLPAFQDLPRGGVVGSIEIVNSVTQSDSPWFCGPVGFVLRNPVPVPFVPCKGSLGFFATSELMGVDTGIPTTEPAYRSNMYRRA